MVATRAAAEHSLSSCQLHNGGPACSLPKITLRITHFHSSSSATAFEVEEVGTAAGDGGGGGEPTTSAGDGMTIMKDL